MRKTVALLTLLALGGCNDAAALRQSLAVPPIAPQAAPALKCPPDVAALPTYSGALQRQVAGEMRTAGGAVWPRLVSDWVYKRQQIRALCK